MGSIYCYIRVSSRDQHEDRQLIIMNEYGIPKRNFYVDKQSGKDFDRPKYKKLVRKLKRTIFSISRVSTDLAGTTPRSLNSGDI